MERWFDDAPDHFTMRLSECLFTSPLRGEAKDAATFLDQPFRASATMPTGQIERCQARGQGASPPQKAAATVGRGQCQRHVG
jgi:hypothetical protein